MGRQNLTGLRPEAYEHPLDRQALDALTNTPGLETLVRKCNEWGLERLLRVQFTGSHLRVTADNFPTVHEALYAACEVLDVPRVPDIYIAPGNEINAFTAGVDHPLIVLNAGAVDLLTDDEIFFVIAHEVGHIKSAHVLYYQIAEFLPIIGGGIGAATFGFGELLTAGLQVALTHWKRMSELTADRAGLLACQDLNAAITVMAKLAGLPQKFYKSLNTEDFIDQARAFEEMDANKLNKLARWVAVANSSHPWTVLRAKEFLRWYDSAGYQQVLEAPQRLAVALPPGIQRYCTECGRGLAGKEQFCPSCGKRLTPTGK